MDLSKIKKIHNLFYKKEVSCVELTKKYLSGIESCNKGLNAYVCITEDEALKTAELVDQRIAKGEKLYPLEGIPMTLKDNISTKGIKTTCCSKMLADYVPIYDATVWEILKGQNAILLGKTNMDEFAMGSSCRTSRFGGARNPYDTSCVPGGSSGGGASAVGGNIAVYALGSDTGGSIRQPASFSGIVGLKPTHGTISRYGNLPYASSFDQMGPMTASVEDAAIVFDSLAQQDRRDPTCPGKFHDDILDSLDNDIKGLKIGIIKETFEGATEEVLHYVEKAIDVYMSLGAEIVYLDMPIIKYSLPIYYVLTCAEVSANLGCLDGIRFGHQVESYDSVKDMMSKARSEGFGKEVQRRILLGTYVLTKDYYNDHYKKARVIRQMMIDKFNELFKSCDIILTPTSPSTAFKHSYVQKDPVEGYLADICTVPANVVGVPAISVPCGFDSKGLPIGMQLIGDKFDEKTILNAAYKFEKNTCDYTVKPANMGVHL